MVAILISALASLKAALSANGLFLGLIVFLFKFASSVLLSFLVIAKFKDLIDQKSTFATRFAAMVLLGLFSWLINALVNGERVEQRKIEERGNFSRSKLLSLILISNTSPRIRSTDHQPPILIAKGGTPRYL